MDYDAFLSHSHVDAEWTRGLYGRIAATDYNGRNLRPWLDQEILDPGELASVRELESALDRSRFMVLVLAPESAASRWVQHEIGYFTGIRGPEAVLVVRRRPCAIPPRLSRAKLIECPEPESGEGALSVLVDALKPAAEPGYAEYQRRRAVRRAWTSARYAQPPGLDPTPTSENSALLKTLLSYDIEDLDEEGPALVGFDRVGQLVGELDSSEGYGVKMVLGEFLALASLRQPTYGQVAARYVSQDLQALTRPSFLTFRNRALRGATSPPSTTNLLLAVARAGSKIAEIDPARIDLSTMAAVLYSLDARPTLSEDEVTVAMMVGRLLGKLRGSALVQLLIHTVVRWGGEASHIAAAGAISTSYEAEDAAFYFTSELAEIARELKSREATPAPSKSIARLLLDPASEMHIRPSVHPLVGVARDDFIKNFGSDWPLGTGLWPALAFAPVPTTLTNGPLVGTVRLVTRDNMERVAEDLGPTEIACLTQPRIVDALLAAASGYLISDEEADGPLGQRLRNRGARFATFQMSRLARFEDGGIVALWPGSEDEPSSGFLAGG